MAQTIPDLTGKAPMEAQTAFDDLVFNQIAEWRDGSISEDQIARLVKGHFDGCAVDRSAPNNSSPHVLLLWPNDGGKVLGAVQMSLGLEAMEKMDDWARGQLREQGRKIGYGSDHVWLFVQPDAQPDPNGDDGHG